MYDDINKHAMAQAATAKVLIAQAPPLAAAGGSGSGFEGAVYAKVDELAGLLLSKHRDYGPFNIARSPGGPLNGLRVRLHDKLARIIHLTSEEPEHESLRDSFVDLANYALIGVLVLDGDWPSA